MANQNAKIYSFKSVGVTETERSSRSQDRERDEPIGFKTPLELSYDNSSLFAMHKDLPLQIRDNFRNMLSTNHGERLMLHDFGANLTPLAFELGAEAIDTVAINRIKRTTDKYMPYISLDTFETFTVNDDVNDLAKIGIRITYSVPSIFAVNQVVEAIIYAGG